MRLTDDQRDLAAANFRLACRLAHAKHARDGGDLDQRLSDAALGVCLAAARHNPERGAFGMAAGLYVRQQFAATAKRASRRIGEGGDGPDRAAPDVLREWMEADAVAAFVLRARRLCGDATVELLMGRVMRRGQLERSAAINAAIMRAKRQLAAGGRP